MTISIFFSSFFSLVLYKQTHPNTPRPPTPLHSDPPSFALIKTAGQTEQLLWVFVCCPCGNIMWSVEMRVYSRDRSAAGHSDNKWWNLLPVWRHVILLQYDLILYFLHIMAEASEEKLFIFSVDTLKATCGELVKQWICSRFMNLFIWLGQCMLINIQVYM